MTTQYKYEVIITAIKGSSNSQEDMLSDLYAALKQEMGFYVEDIQVKQVGFALRDD